jgi:hypothetical protein
MGNAGRMGKIRNVDKIFSGKPEETTPLGVSKKIILKWIL